MKMETVYYTAHALKRGILKVDGFVSEGGTFTQKKGRYENTISKGCWAWSQEEAIKQAHAARDKEVESLLKEIERLRKLTFEIW